jgi:Mg2+ and Co2+ transporter CorA
MRKKFNKKYNKVHPNLSIRFKSPEKLERFRNLAKNSGYTYREALEACYDILDLSQSKRKLSSVVNSLSEERSRVERQVGELEKKEANLSQSVKTNSEFVKKLREEHNSLSSFCSELETEIRKICDAVDPTYNFLKLVNELSSFASPPLKDRPLSLFFDYFIINIPPNNRPSQEQMNQYYQIIHQIENFALNQFDLNRFSETRNKLSVKKAEINAKQMVDSIFESIKWHK